VRRVFKERVSLLLSLMGCVCLAMSQAYDKPAAHSKNLISCVLNIRA
jgi:hypothetical protein